MEGNNWEKLSIALLVAGFIVGGIGAGLSFFLGPWLAPLFYLGFLLVIIGFALAVLLRAAADKSD